MAYGYDRLGRQTTILQGKSVTTRAFNAAGQMLSESYSGGVLDGLAVTNGYDQFFRRTNLAATANATGASAGVQRAEKGAKPEVLTSVDYAYDAAARLHTVTEDESSAEYQYLANSSLVEQILFRNAEAVRMTTAKKYDRLNRGITLQPSADDSMSYTYEPTNADSAQITATRLSDYA